MKIGINAHFFKYPSSGIGQYLIHLANTLIEIDQHNHYNLFASETNISDGFRYKQHHSTYPVPAWAKRNPRVAQVLWEQWTYPAATQKGQMDIVHYPYLAAPLLPRKPTIVTIPDVIHCRVPEYLEGQLKRIYIKINMQAATQAAAIITLSEHAKQDIIDLLHIPAERVRVIYLAAGDEYTPVPDPSIQAETREQYGLGKRYIFYLGGLDRRKNVLQLIRAFAQLDQRIADPDLQLFIAGNPDKHIGGDTLFPDPRPLAASLEITDRIIYGFVTEKDKPALYSGAEVFVFPSLYEGFGLPPLEAMKCGAPVICSNRTSLPEVIGDAAISLDPDNTAALVDAMYRVLTDKTLRDDLCARSLRRASLFSWHRTAAQTIAVYEDVFALKRSP